MVAISGCKQRCDNTNIQSTRVRASMAGMLAGIDEKHCMLLLYFM
jgi:hypothetical protein